MSTDDNNSSDRSDGKSATGDNNDGSTATLKNEIENLRKQVRDLTSQRDKNYDDKTKDGKKLDDAMEWINTKRATDSKREAINDFVNDPENKKRFPNVSKKHLEELATSPDQLDDIASRLQRVYEDAEEEAIEKAKAGESDSLTVEQALAEEKKIKSSDDDGKFEKIMNIRFRKRKT